MKFRKDFKEVQGSGKSNYLRLKDGESVTGICRGNIHEFWSLWNNKKSEEVPEGTPGAKFRFRVNFVMKEGTAYVQKILEQGRMVYDQLSAIHEEYNLEQTIIKITRDGSEMDTTYTVLPLKQSISQETMKYLDSIELLDVGGGPQFLAQDLEFNKQKDDDLPF